MPVSFAGEAVTDWKVGLPKNDNKITIALTYEGHAGHQENRPDRIAKHTVIEAGNGPLAEAEREATTFATRALYGAKDSTNCCFTNQVWFASRHKFQGALA